MYYEIVTGFYTRGQCTCPYNINLNQLEGTALVMWKTTTYSIGIAHHDSREFRINVSLWKDKEHGNIWPPPPMFYKLSIAINTKQATWKESKEYEYSSFHYMLWFYSKLTCLVIDRNNFSKELDISGTSLAGRHINLGRYI